jgi:LPXTG-site transpeptidase (sortase) family protein
MIDDRLGPRSRRSGASRRTAAVLAGVIVVALVVLASGFGRGPAGASGSSGSAAFSDIPLVTVGPTPSRLPTASPSGLASASPTASPVAGAIRANHIRIARLGIDLAIVEGDGVDAPMGKAAHYPGSAWPGGGSNIYIYGHAQKGMFLPLWDARVGDIIELGLVDGTARTYTVHEVLPKVPWNALRYTDPTATEQLTLQTSTSNYSTAPRFIVIALPTS